MLVDGEPRPKRHALVAGEVVVFRPLPPPVSRLVPEPVPFVVRYEDDHLLVIDKPAGVVVHPAPGHATGSAHEMHAW